MKLGFRSLAALTAAAVLLACARPLASSTPTHPGDNSGILGSGSVV
jgi:hypothetical protein